MTPPGGLEPPTFRLTAERASRLRHGGGRAAYAPPVVDISKLTDDTCIAPRSPVLSMLTFVKCCQANYRIIFALVS